MKFLLVFLMLITVSCGKKQDSASESKAAPASEPGIQKIGEETPPPAEVPKSEDPAEKGPATGEISAMDVPADTRDATPVNRQEPVVPGGDKDEDKPGVPKDVVKPTTVSPKTGGGVITMGTSLDAGTTGGGPVGIKDEPPKKKNPKRATKPDPQASGYHEMDQDEPTQE